MNIQELRRQLDTCRLRHLQAVARSCKAAGLCGGFSKMRKPALIEMLANLPWERLQPHLRPSLRDRAWSYRNEIGIILGLVAGGVFWFWPRATINDDLAAAQRASNETILQQSRNDATQLEVIRALQVQLSEQLQQTDRLTAGIADALGTLPLRNREIQRSAQKLSDVLSTFTKSHAGKQLSSQADSELRLAQATVNLANNRFNEVLEHLSEPAFDQIEQRAAISMKQMVAAGGIRGLAFEGLGRWDEAIAVYSRIARIDPSAPVGLRIAYCLYSSGRSVNAIAALDVLLERSDVVVAAPKTVNHFEASAYRLRAIMEGSLGDLKNAVCDLKKSIDISTESGDDPLSLASAQIDLAIYAYDQDRAESDAACVRADELLKQQDGDSDDVASEISRLRNHRARESLENGQLQEAVALAQSVVAVRRNRVARHDDLDARRWMAESLNNLGAICGGGDDPKLAIEPLSEAIEILSRLVDVHAQHTAIPDYVQALVNRADAWCKIRRANAACSDAKSAVRLARVLVDLSKDRKNLTSIKCLAQASRSYSTSLERTGRFDDALLQVDSSIDLFKKLEQLGFPGSSKDIAFAMGQRGQLLMSLRRLPDAATQLEDVIERCNQFGKNSLSVDVRVLRLVARHKLAMCLNGMGQDDRAVSAYQSIIDDEKSSPNAPLEIRLWLVRTKANLVLLLCSSSKVQDSKRALELSKEAVHELGTEWVTQHALAAAYADSGDFSGAAETESRALPQCPQGFKKLAEEALAGYKAQKTLRKQTREPTD